jgi:hypothetical protein
MVCAKAMRPSCWWKAPSPKVVLERLEHSSNAITLDPLLAHHRHPQEDAATRLDLAFGPAIRRLSLASKKRSSNFGGNRLLAYSAEVVFVSDNNCLEGWPSGLRHRS